MTLNNLKLYTPEYADLMFTAIYLQTDDGLDWYYHRNKFKPDTMKIGYDSEGVICTFDRNVERLWPVGLSVTEVDMAAVPDELDINGEWVWNGGAIVPRPVSDSELERQAAARRDELLAMATAKIAPLQDAVDLGMATEAETTLLQAWKTYRVLLNRIDITAQDITWPEVPGVA
ncbi:tail fiber assembly protein [Atlantibacter subterraneus]|uniref:tail fiber assembly protein n=1 Tax=Atlantibacter subterraneus TaxID=255519 RepID=UPI002FDDA580